MKKLPKPEPTARLEEEFPEEVAERARREARAELRQAISAAEDAATAPPSSASALLRMATGIVQHELSRLQKKAFDRGLDSRDHGSLKLLVGTLTEVTAEERVLSKNNDFKNISDDEVERQAREALGIATETVAAEKKEPK